MLKGYTTALVLGLVSFGTGVVATKLYDQPKAPQPSLAAEITSPALITAEGARALPQPAEDRDWRARPPAGPSSIEDQLHPTDTVAAKDAASIELDEQIASEKAHAAALAMAYEQHLQAEQLDPDWAGSGENHIRQAVSLLDVADLNVVDVQCRSTVCRLHLSQTDSQSSGFETVRHKFIQHLGEELPTGSMFVTEPGEIRIYLSRKGYELPMVQDVHDKSP